MLYLTLLCILFLIISGLVLLLPPDRMAEEQHFKTTIDRIGLAIKLCQTASIGHPLIKLKPPNRQVRLDLKFDHADFVTLEIPLLLKKQQLKKSAYLEVFNSLGLNAAERQNHHGHEILTAQISRSSESLKAVVEKLYLGVFGMTKEDRVNLFVTPLKCDALALPHYFSKSGLINPDYEYVSQSSQHSGRSKTQILAHRILTAANLLLYPVFMILSYQNWSVKGLCLAALLFFAFYFLYRVFIRRNVRSDQYGVITIAYLVLVMATLLTENSAWIKFVPTTLAVLILGILIGQILGLTKDKFTDINKQSGSKTFQVLGLIAAGIFLALSEWARRSLEFESWVWFFAFMRIELMVGALILILPALLLMADFSEDEADPSGSKSDP